MVSDPSHHTSKKRHYTVLLVRTDDVSATKNVRLRLWQVASLMIGSVALVVAVVFALLFYTPLGTWVNIPNPELEIRYTQELVTLNQKMASLMEQLVQLRGYNVKLRNALGEQAVATDSGIVVTGTARSQDNNRITESRRQPSSGPGSIASTAFYPLPVETAVEPDRKISFPAILPTEGYITRGYLPEQHHFGLDIAGKIGTPVNAAADGYVVFAGWTNEDGYVVILSHADGFLTFYKHNQSLLKTANTFVKRGEPIALLGDSGRTSAGPHLHFEIWKDGTPVNPSAYLLNLNL
jgi:murein DD-endopeptidase MepM/ murein hydrolase activator NlpD